MDKRKSLTRLTTTALMTALVCIIAPFSIPLPITLVPITFATFIIYITAYILPWQYCVMSTVLYLLLGLIGLPVFSGFGSGIGKLAGPTGGYLAGYIFLAFISSNVNHKFENNICASVIGMTAGITAAYIFGTAWFSVQQHMSFYAALGLCVVPFIVGDIIKIIAAAILGPIILKRLKKAQLL